jgi:hypothetical protein
VQVLVVGFDQPTFSGAVLAELMRLGEAGVVRLVDVLVVERATDGTFETRPAPPGLPAHSGSVAAALLADPERHQGEQATAVETPAASTWSLADAVPAGTTAAVALIEHLWATPLRDAIHGAGGAPLDETWLAPDDVQRLETLLTAADLGDAPA